MVVALRVLLLLAAGILTVLSFAAPAQAAVECGAGTAAGDDAGLACGVDEDTTGLGLDACVEVPSDESAFEFHVLWETPVWTDGTYTITETPCAAHAGQGDCQAWADESPGPYPNAGTDCHAAALEGPACADFDEEEGVKAGTVGMGVTCGDYEICGPDEEDGVFRCSVAVGSDASQVCAEVLDGRWASGFRVAGWGTTGGCGREQAPQDL